MGFFEFERVTLSLGLITIYDYILLLIYKNRDMIYRHRTLKVKRESKMVY